MTKNYKKKILIIGSNFGERHYCVLNQNYKFNFYIYSPNILKKKNKFKKAKLINNENYLIQNNSYHTIVCCTNPVYQKNIINKIIKKKIFCKYLMFEKPLSDDLVLIKKLYKHCLSNKVNFHVNFTYSHLKISKIISKKISTFNFEKVFFDLDFFHHYLRKKNNSWKNFIKFGGGVVNYYLIHIIFLFVSIFPKLKIDKINVLLNSKVLTGLNIKFKHNNSDVFEMRIKLDSLKNVHKYQIIKKSEKVEIFTKQKDWYKIYNFKIIKKNKIKSINIFENLDDAIKKNYKKLFIKFNKNKLNSYYNIIYNTQKICNDINKRIKIYDFKKM